MDLKSAVEALKKAEAKAKALWEKTESGEVLTPDDIQFLMELVELETQSDRDLFGGYAAEILRRCS
jgi:hypothetical protein